MGDGFLAGKRVLLAEDDPLEAIAYCEWLCEHGAEVIGPIASVRQALSLLESTEVDVGVIDFALADSNSAGLQVALEKRNIPFVVVTGYPRPLVRRNKDQVILPKPVFEEDLCASVRSLCHV